MKISITVEFELECDEAGRRPASRFVRGVARAATEVPAGIRLLRVDTNAVIAGEDITAAEEAAVKAIHDEVNEALYESLAGKEV